MIRRAKIGDLHVVGELVRRAWEKTQPFSVNEDKLRRIVHNYMKDQRVAVFVSDIEGEVRGLIACSVHPMDIADGKDATDHVFYCESGEGKQLIQAYVDWAKSKGADLINMTVSSGSKRADKLIKACGFKRAGGNFYYE